MKHQINIYYKDSLLFSESFRNLEEAKESINRRVLKFPISLLSLLRRKQIPCKELNFKDFSFEYEELRLSSIEALKTDLCRKGYTFWVHNFMRFCPNFKVEKFKSVQRKFFEPYTVKENTVGTKVLNEKYGYTHAFTLELKK